jgi:hypothetical protein
MDRRIIQRYLLTLGFSRFTNYTDTCTEYNFCILGLFSKNSTYGPQGKEFQKWTHSTAPGAVLLYNGAVAFGVVLFFR